MSAPNAIITKRPFSFIYNTSPVIATASNNSSQVEFNSPSHGLITGNYIYIYSLLGSYNGFWYVNVVDSNNFFIQESQNLPIQGFINSGTVTYYTTSSYQHGFNCLHLPIVYKFSNTLWPINNVNSSTTVLSFSNDSNYVKLTLGASLGSFNALNYIKISGANSSTVNGPFQILTITSSSVITINLPYNSSYDFTNGSVILYFNNYKINVNVWAGLNASHPWAIVNPYSKILSLSIIPDSNNNTQLNINEYLKSNIDVISNDLQLDTLPSNTSFFSQFYIEYSESYDQSDGLNVTTYTSNLVSDQSVFEGVACNSKLPFKSRQSGFLSDYLTGGNGEQQKFLTNFSSPVIYPSEYFDLSFILTDATTNVRLKRDVYKSNKLVATYYDTITYMGLGIYRWPITQSGWSEDYVNCTLIGKKGAAFKPNAFTSGFNIATNADVVMSETKTISFSTQCFKQQYNLSWLNYLGGFDYWQFTGFGTHGVDIAQVQTQTKNLLPSWPNSYGEFANTIISETKRVSSIRTLVRSQNVNLDQVDSIAAIKESPLVQIVNNQYDSRTVLVDKNSFDIRKDGDKTFHISFTITYTDDIPSQQL